MRAMLVLIFALVASLSFAQQPPNCPLGGAIVAADNSVWVCKGSGAAPVQVSTGGSGSAAWGDISGTLANQTDLQTALNAKQAAGSYLAPDGNGSQLTNLTKGQVGLGNVDNTSDASKPISTATQTALGAKQATLLSGTNIKTINGSSVLGAGDLVVGGGAVAWGDVTDKPAAVEALTGTNTGDQTITLTGNVTGSGTGSFATTIANGAVSTVKLGGDITTAGKALLDDADATAQRNTLGLGAGDIAAFALPIGSVGVGVFDTGGDHVLTIKSGENLTSERNLTVIINDASRTLTLSGNATVSGTNTGDQTSVTGNAGSATVLQTARTINGVSFNGSANITVPAAGSTLTDNVPVSKLNSGTGASSSTYWRGDGTWATPAGGGSSDTVLRLTGDVSTGANVTLVDLTGLAFTADAGGIYKIEIWAIVQSPVATTGYGIGINCAQAPVTVSLTGSSQLANTGTVSAWSAIANNAIVGVTSGVPSAATNTPVHGGGVLVAHATNAGTCTMRFRSETTAVTTMKANSVVIVRKVN